MSDLSKWILSFVLTAVAILISYHWFDRPIAYFVHEHVRKYDIFDRMFPRFPTVITPLASIIIVVLGYRALTKRPLSHLQSVMVLCCLSFFVAEGIKTYAKLAFGRMWPDTIRFDYPSLIRDGAYGFYPYHGGFPYTSFPSGHMTAVCAIASVLWVCYPRYKPLYLLTILATAIALIAPNYHFLGDVIGGAFLGISTGWIATAMWRNGSQARF